MYLGYLILALAALLLLAPPIMYAIYWLQDRREAALLDKAIEIDAVPDSSAPTKPPLNFTEYVQAKDVEALLRQTPSVTSGRQDIVTVGFTNIHNWVGLCESLGDSAAVAFLNRFHALAITAIRNERGIILNMIGDQCFFAFNAVRRDPAHALSAVNAALAMSDSFSELLSEVPSLKITIALVTGECVMGDVGSPQYTNYAVLGDRVNLAASLSKLSATAPVPISLLLSSDTAKAVQHLYPLTSRKLAVKGLQNEIDIFELSPPTSN